MEGLTHPHYNLELGPATFEAVDEVVALARTCVDHLTSCGILQWDHLYPDRESVERDIRNGAALLARHRGEVVAYLAIDSDQDSKYAQVDWHFSETPIAVVHRLMVSPAWQGRGLGRWCVTIAEQTAVRRGYATMRLEAYTHNPHAIRLYERCGYRASGIIHFRTGEFTCFEKALVGPL
ncbi:MAG: GNAT family N-acetyltransferase [Coriobacteriia bacterium]